MILLAAAVVLAGVAFGASALDLQGHRGARGVAPENTLPGFATTLAIGVSTLEMDLGVTADDRLVVIHDSRLNPALTRGPEGRWLSPPTPAVRELSLRQLQAYDVGRIDPASRYARLLAGQAPHDGARIPTLAEVVELTRAAGNDMVRFNVETKIDPEQPELTATADDFARLVVEEIGRLGIAERTTVQSFDWRTLRAVQALAPEIATACLTAQRPGFDTVRRGEPGASPWTAGLDADEIGGVPDLVKAAGCRIWSPAVDELNKLSLAEAHWLGLKVVPWTVNDTTVMNSLIDAEIDGIITDYPDRLRELMRRRGLPLPAATPVPAPAEGG